MLVGLPELDPLPLLLCLKGFLLDFDLPDLVLPLLRPFQRVGEHRLDLVVEPPVLEDGLV